MRATWMFRAVRQGCERTVITRNAERETRNRTLQGTEREALEFARRACEYLRPKGVESVEAWSIGPVEGAPDELPGLVRFCLRAEGVKKMLPQ